jgi:AcrR family transcriptional regulator
MSRKRLENIDEAILEKTIELGGNSEANRSFSTKDIAEACAISEYTVFSRYKSKDLLLAKAGERVYQALSSEAILLAEGTTTVHDFFNRYLDWLIANPTYTFFTLNYGHGVPHIAPLADDRTSHREKVITDAANILSKFGIEPVEDYLLLWSYMLRHLIYFAAYVLNDPRTDTKENRFRNEMIVNCGLNAFVHNLGGEA